MPKITPKQAFDAIKLLYPATVKIEPDRCRTSDSLSRVYTDDKCYTLMAITASVDWANLTQYPAIVYRDATIDDVKTQPEAEFSDHQDFCTIQKGKLIGYLTLGTNKRWYCGSPTVTAISYNYCRIPVPAPKPAPPEGWRELTEADKRAYSVCTPDYAALMCDDGVIFRRCYYQISEQQWRASGSRDLPKAPKYIRDDWY